MIDWYDTSDWQDVEKESGKNAMKFLQKEFGNNFLVNASAIGHPLVMYIVNRQTQWGRRWLVWFAEALRILKSEKNYSSLLARLKQKSGYHEAFSVMQSAYDFKINNLQITFDAKVQVGTQLKKPDLQVTDPATNEISYVEVSIIGEATGSQMAGEQMHKIYFALSGKIPYVHIMGRLLKLISTTHLEEILAEIQRLYQKCIGEQKLQELLEEDVIELAMAPDEDFEHLRKWARDRGLAAAFEGPGVDVNMLARVRQRIDNEQEQLPANSANMIVINSHEFFFRTRDKAAAINALEETVYGHPHLLALLIVGQYIGEGHERIQKHKHLYRKDTWMSMGAEERLIIQNRFCGIKISDSTKIKFYRALGIE